jgi:effector-binding domain-containing protein
MKRILFIPVLVTSAYLLQAQEPTVQENAPFWYVCMSFRGGEYEVPQRLGDFFQEIQRQGLQSSLLGNPIGIYFNHPLRVTGRDTVWGLGFRISEDAQVKPPLKKMHFNYQKTATMVFMGPYESMGLGLNIMVPYLEENNLEVIGPPIFGWLDDPNRTRPDSCRTEFIIPVSEIKK